MDNEFQSQSSIIIHHTTDETLEQSSCCEMDVGIQNLKQREVTEDDVTWSFLVYIPLLIRDKFLLSKNTAVAHQVFSLILIEIPTSGNNEMAHHSCSALIKHYITTRHSHRIEWETRMTC